MQELEVGPRSGSYLLVLIKSKRKEKKGFLFSVHLSVVKIIDHVTNADFMHVWKGEQSGRFAQVKVTKWSGVQIAR